MRIYPAIDIKDGKCVRLLQGRFSDMTFMAATRQKLQKDGRTRARNICTLWTWTAHRRGAVSMRTS